MPAWGSELLVGHRLRLDLGDTRDLLECLKEVGLGRMARLLPWPEGVERHSGEELEVEASTADGAGDNSALELLELGQILVHDIGNLNQRLGAVLAAAIVLPLAPPLTADILEAHLAASHLGHHAGRRRASHAGVGHADHQRGRGGRESKDGGELHVGFASRNGFSD